MPTFNKALYLDLTLAGFSIQNYKDYEIVIIDDGSTDNTFEVVEKYKGICNIKFKYQSNHGRSHARNNGLQIAQGKYIIFNDDDRIPSPDFINQHLNTLKHTSKVVSIGSKHSILSFYTDKLRTHQSYFLKLLERDPSKLNKILTNGNSPLFSVNELIHNFKDIISEWYLYEPRDNFKDISSNYSQCLEGFLFGWALATTGNMSFTREDSYGLRFDENYEGWGLEDTDFAYQLHLKGCKFNLSPSAVNFHQVHGRGIGEWHQLKRNIKYFCNKYENIDTYLFAQVFEEVKGKKDFSFIEANEVLIKLLSIPNDDSLIKNYIRLCKLQING